MKKAAPSEKNTTTKTAPSSQAVFGHTAQRKFFAELFKQNRFPSTLLLTGPGGIGKRLVAQEIARSFFCEQQSWGGCKSCSPCVRFSAATTTDLYQIDFADDKTSAIENIRELIYSLQLKSFSGKNRVIIFDNAHQMSVATSNLLLKSLEEPRPHTYFILISSSKARMLPTLLSRCQTTHFEALSLTEIKSIIDINPEIIPSDISKKDLEFILNYSDGTFENLLSFAHEYQKAQTISTRIDSIIDGDTVEATRLAVELAKDKDSIEASIRLLTTILRSKLREKHSISTIHRIAVALQNVVAVERYTFERNLSPAYLLSFLMTQLLPTTNNRENREPLLIENVVV